MIRVTVDPGVLLSAFISPRRSAPALIVGALLDGRITVLACPALVAELRDVLAREKFARHAADGRADAYVTALLERVEQVADPPAGKHRTADPDDDYLLALAEAHTLDAVISGDKHLLDAGTDQLPVLTARQLTDQLGLTEREPGKHA